jgi:hypothetical protein
MAVWVLQESYTMSLAKVLAQAEAQQLDAHVDTLSGCKTLAEGEVIELAAKCKVGPLSAR